MYFPSQCTLADEVTIQHVINFMTGMVRNQGIRDDDNIYSTKFTASNAHFDNYCLISDARGNTIGIY